ncbi:MAG: hypothetical protein QM769_12095 [Pseudoxanthomonas sp.]
MALVNIGNILNREGADFIQRPVIVDGGDTYPVIAIILLRQRVQFDTLVKAGANHGVQVRAKRAGAGEVFVRAASILTGGALRVSRELNRLPAAGGDRNPVTLVGMQRRPNLPATINCRRPLRRRQLGPLQVLVNLRQLGLQFVAVGTCPNRSAAWWRRSWRTWKTGKRQALQICRAQQYPKPAPPRC